MSSGRLSMIAEYVAAKYCQDACGHPFPQPNRPLPEESTQQPRDVRKLSPRPRREAPQHTPSAVAPQALQVSPPITPEASLQKSASALGPSHFSAVGDGVSTSADVKQQVIINSVGRLTSLLLQRQDLEAQLCMLEAMSREHSPPGVSPRARRDTSRQPFTERLAGILPSSMISLRDSNYSTHPRYSMPLAEFFDDAPCGVKHVRRPAPLNLRSLQSRDYRALQVPRFKGTCEFIKDSYQDTMLKLAAVDLEIELTYLSEDRQTVRSA